VVESGGPNADELERNGYERFTEAKPTVGTAPAV
jgi:hypothetical protein